MRKEVEEWILSKLTACFSGETHGDTYLPLDGDTRGDIRSHSKEVVVHVGMDDFHRRIVLGVDDTTTYVSAILAVNRDKKREIPLVVSMKERKYRSDRIAARLVAYIISKEKTTQQVSFADEKLDTMNDVSMP